MSTLSTSLTASQAARRLGLSAARIAQLRLNGQLPAYETPLGYLYRVEDVDRLAQERAAAVPAPLVQHPGPGSTEDVR